ncbi:MAG: DUF2318 domain-containing protein [Deltaproteobacteria bacterium]|jgi:uncharacterized membrane protein|nr:DUF2318 domain-containing protein [Deltaproteobacteria bacterium]
MLLYLINVVDDCWLLAVAAPLLLFLGRDDPRPPLRRGLFLAALALGVAAAAIYSYLKRTTGWVVREYYDIAILWPLLAVLAAVIVFGIMAGRKGARAGAALRVLCPASLWLLLARALPDLFLLPLDFDVGLDSVFNMDYLAKASGFCGGILLMLLASAGTGSLVKRLPSRAASPAAALTLASGFLFLALDAFRVMYVRGMLPRASWIPKVIILLRSHENVFLYAVMCVWCLAAFAAVWQSLTSRPEGPNPAAVRKGRYALKLQFRAAAFLVLVLAATLVTVTALRAYQRRGPVISEPGRVEASGGTISLDLKIVGDGNLHRHVYMTEGGTDVRFIVVRKTANAFGVGLDACDICGPTGYYQRGDQVICKLCDVVMNKSTIGFPGGCNPVPLNFRIEGGMLLIAAADLEKEKRRFQ